MSKIINQLNRFSIFASHHRDSRASQSLSTFRLSTFGLLLTFNFSFLISACGLDVEDPTPPSPPVWVEKSPPEEWPERGIDAHESGGIFLEWEPILNEDILGYKIYRATYYNLNDSLGDYQLISQQETTSESDLYYLDEYVQILTKYIYKIKSYDTGNNNSTFSDSFSYMLLPQIDHLNMIPNSINDQMNEARELSWIYEYLGVMQYYCISILTDGNELVTRVKIYPGTYIGRRDFWQIPPEIELDPVKIYKWRIDTEALNSDGLEAAGSESRWVRFVYVGD